jgi:hypothetical protein
VPVSKIELYAAIRRDAKVEELSSRALSAKYGVGRRTVATALEAAITGSSAQSSSRLGGGIS